MRDLDAERKLVTILLVDIDEVGEDFTERDPEDVGTTLTTYQHRIRDVVTRFGGSVERAIGSRVVAAFGIPHANEDDPTRAVRAALAIRDRIARPAADAHSPVRMSLAVATGEALVRLGHDDRVSGEVVTLCARLADSRVSGEVLVSERTAQATERAIIFGTVEEFTIGDSAQVFTARRAVGPRRRADLDDGGAAGSTFVGRAPELRRLHDAFERTLQSGRPQQVTLVGAPGLGKSRLVAEFGRAITTGRTEPLAWHTGRSLPYGEGMTFWALAEIVKSEVGILAGDTSRQTTRKLDEAAQATFPEDSRAAAWVTRHLRLLVGTEGGPPARAGEQHESLAAWRRFLLGRAAQRPLILVVEDLHWADDALLDFLDGLVAPSASEYPGHTPLLIVGTARPGLVDRRPDWPVSTLGPLPERETAQLLESLLAAYGVPTPRGSSAEVRADLLARVGGNPLFAEEYVRMLRDRDLPVLPGSPPPATVHSIIAARVDALPQAEKETLQDAAVLGRSGWLGALATVGGRDRADLEPLVAALARRELLQWSPRSSVTGERELEFRHVLVRDVAYAQLLRAERAGKHERAARWLESLPGADPADEPGERATGQAELIAHHYEQALVYAQASHRSHPELAARAVRALRAAGDRTASLGVHVNAARYYLRALDLLPEDSPERPDLQLGAGRSLCRADNTGDELLVRARDAFLGMSDRGRAAEAEVLLGQVLYVRGAGGQTVHFRQALELVHDLPPSPAKADVLLGGVLHYAASDQYQEVTTLGDVALGMARELGQRETEAEILGTMGYARVCGGDSGGVADLKRCITILQGSGSPYLARWYINLGTTLELLGDLHGCYEAWSTASREAERLGLERDLRWIRFDRASEDYRTGHWDGVLRRTDEMVSESSRGGGHYLESGGLIWRGRVRLARGQVQAAVDDAARALELARESGDRQNLEPGLVFGARASVAAGRAEQARVLFDELLDGFGAWLLKPEVGVDLAVVLIALGQPMRSVLDRGVLASPWLEAVGAFVEGDPGRAAAIYAEIGSRPDEAYARLEAARQLASEGRTAEARMELDAAEAFYREVGATAYLAAADELRLTLA